MLLKVLTILSHFMVNENQTGNPVVCMQDKIQLPQQSTEQITILGVKMMGAWELTELCLHEDSSQNKCPFSSFVYSLKNPNNQSPSLPPQKKTNKNPG